MVSKHLFGIFFLFFYTIGFVSCSDNDDSKQEYHLKLSERSYEVVQGRGVTISLTAHQNITLDIEKPELIDAVYTWEFGNYKAKIEIKGKQEGKTNIVIIDHETGESVTINVEVTKYPMPCLAAEKTQGNIFDLMVFYLYNEGSQSSYFNDLSAVCDSVVWTVDGIKGSFRVFEYKKGDGIVESHLSRKWSHCFMYPGEYKNHLTVWKGNKIIFRHQLDITISDNKDFLKYNWSEITKNSQSWEGYTDELHSSPNLITTYGLNGIIPFVEVRLFNSEIYQSNQPLYDYFSKLYSAPTYEDQTEKHKMWKLYDDLFSEQKKYPNAYPVAIWVTKRANIILLLMDESMDNPGYVIYAEPNGQ